jgi:hypothetical protein
MSSFSLSGGVEVLGFISPTDSLDTYAVIDPLYGIDGFRNVNLLSDLNLIPAPRRRAGMVVGVSGGTSYYKLNSSPWNYNFTDWSVFNTGGGGNLSGDYLPLSGGTVTGNTVFTLGLSANTISATTYQNLPIDIRVTGGTYSNGTTTFTNNTGGTFNVNGFYTGETSYVNSLTAGFGLSADTTTGVITIINTDPDQTVVLNDGTNISVTGTYPNFTIDVTGLTDFNTFTTGFTYQDNTFTILDNSGSTYNATINSVTGLTVNGTLSATTISATTYQNLPITTDVFVTGGTYSAGTSTFTNNTGGTFNVTGFYTGETSYVNSLTTGFGLSADTTNGDITIINTDPDQVVTISGGTGILTGGTYPNFTIENTLPDQTVVLNDGTNISVTGTYPNFTIDVTGLTDFNTFTTGFTYQDNTFTISDNSGNTFDATFTEVTGLTVNGDLNITGTTYSNTISATTYLNLPITTDVFVTGGTYSAGTSTFTNNTGGTFSVSGFVTGDTYVTGLTFNTGNYNLTIGRNDGVLFTDSLAILASDLTVTGGTYDPNTGIATFTNNTGGTFNVTGFLTGFTDTFVTGGTYSNGTATFTNTSGGTFNVSGFYTGGTDVFVTGGTFSAGTVTFTNNTGGTFNVTGFTTAPNLSKILFVDPNGNDSTGTKGNMNLPYLTLEAAKSASTTGDTIYVFPGTYTVTTTATEGLAKDGIAYYFSPDTIINKATTGDIFRTNGFIYGFNVYGYGNFNKTTNTGSVFSSNNILVYGSVTGYGSLVAGSGYTTGLKTTTTTGAGTGLVVNVTSVNGSGGITALSISNPGSTYKVGDVITIVGGATPATITVTSITADFNSDADISFEANDLYSTVASNVFDIRSTARFTAKFNNLLTTVAGGGGFYIDASIVNITMYSIVVTGGRSFGGASGSLGGIASSTLTVTGYLISSTSLNSASAISISAASTATFNVNTINWTGSGQFAIGLNNATVTLNVSSVTSISGQAGPATVFLNGYAGSISGALNLYGGMVGVVNGITAGDVITTYFGTRSNAAGVLITVSGGNVVLQMQNQDTTTGLAISGGIVTLNGNWTNDDISTDAQLTGGILIINGDYEWGGPIYTSSRVYGVNVAGGTLVVKGTIRVNSPSTTAAYSLDASPIQFSSGKVIINGGTLISNVPQATPVRTISANNSVTSIGSGVAGAGYTTGTKSTSGGTGTGLTLSVTNANGITNTTIVNRGSGYTIGDIITVLGGTSLATFVVSAVLEFKVYSSGMNTNLVQNGGTLTGKKKKIRVNIVAVINTQIQLNDNLGSGNIIFTANATTFPSLSQLAQALVTSINANAIQITASQDIPGTDTYFYLESDSADLGFTSSGGINIGEIGLVPGMYPIVPKVLGTIIEDVDVE